MDRRERELERQWRSNQDAQAHAAYLRHLMRRGKLAEDRVVCAAFLGHPGARLAVPENVKPNAVIYKDTLMNNVDIRDYLHWINKLGKRITHRAAFGVMKLCANTFPKDSRLQGMVKITTKYLEKESHETRCELRAGMGNIYPVDSHSIGEALYRKMLFAVRSAISQIAQNRHPNIQKMGILFDDEEVKEAIRKETYPFLLGDYR